MAAWGGETEPVQSLVPQYIGDGLELAIVPTPQAETFRDEMIEVGELTVIMPPGDYGALLTVKTQVGELLGNSRGKRPARVIVGGPERNPAAARAMGQARFPAAASGHGPEAYQLHVGPDPENEGGTLVLLAGNTPSGDFWAMQSLRQITAERDGIHYLRCGSVSDWPRFRGRGNKRPLVWEHRFKANYSWFYKGGEGRFAEVFRTAGAWVQHVKSLDLAHPEWQSGILAEARKGYEQGIREFVIKYDDTTRAMTPATAEKFGGNYFAAQVQFLTALFQAIRSWDDGNRVFFMPQPYWTNAHDLEEYGRGLKAAGGLPAGMGLSFCGQEVLSTAIPLACVTHAQEVLGLTGPSAQIYDNYPRGGDLWAYHGRPADLWQAVETVFPERGTPVTRVTVYDYLWNPEAYQPERSLKLACRELAGRQPEVYRVLYDYVTTWNRERDAASFLPSPEARKQLEESLRTLRAKYDALKPHLDRSALARESELSQRLLRGESWGESAALEERETFHAAMVEHGYKEGVARRRTGAVALDGRLDDAAWVDADVLRPFVLYRQSGPSKKNPDPRTPVAPEEEQTEVRALYDDTHLYIGAVLHHGQPPKFPADESGHKPGERAAYAWRLPCLEICLDPERDRDSYLQIVPNLQGWYFDNHYAGFGSMLGAGTGWHSGLEFQVAVQEKQSVLEARIPFKNLGGTPKPGDRWGAQFCRNLNGLSTWSFMYESYGFRYPKHFGTLVFR